MMEERRLSDIRSVDDGRALAWALASGFGAIKALGDTGILSRPMLGLLCSRRCPGDVVLEAYDLSRSLRNNGITVVGGFHSPMEKDCLELLLRGTQPVVICPARSIDNMRIPKTWRQGVQEGRVLLLSPFETTVRRLTKDAARRRNEFVAALADGLMVPHASRGGEVEAVCRDVLARGKKVFTLASGANQHLLDLGAQPFDIQQASTLGNDRYV
jgi:predicted Rossmann fold nucleotide-binding protein DprA/Smf involved in DNA uptake